jgi:hypothetical protein
MGEEVANTMKEDRNHRGPFLPRRLFGKLHQNPSLKNDNKEIIGTMIDAALRLYRQKSKKLQLSSIEIR